MTDAQTRPLAVVTGASSGIGYELARQFAEHGYDLVIVAEDAGITQAARDMQALGTTVESVRADLATWDGVERLWNTATTGGRHPDAVAINAGVGVGGEFTETDLRAEIKLVQLNCESVVHLAKLAARDMVNRGEGRILITSSIAGTMPGPYEAVYAASKAFDLSFAEALRHEVKDSGVTVTARHRVLRAGRPGGHPGRPGHEGRPGGGGQGRLRGADGRQGQGGRRLRQEQGAGRVRAGDARPGEGRDARQAVRARIWHQIGGTRSGGVATSRRRRTPVSAAGWRCAGRPARRCRPPSSRGCTGCCPGWPAARRARSPPFSGRCAWPAGAPDGHRRPGRRPRPCWSRPGRAPRPRARGRTP